MSKKEKLVQKIKNAKEANFEDIHLLLTHLGFNWRCRGTSHYTYIKAPYVIVIARRSGKPVKKVYLENVRDLLEKMGL
ncbi:MAG: hypothetical protein ACUVTU_08185 [Desulfurispora sp.]|uniref:hypothetical protein n=1 Tax=Desulfurispora sp. TaxID=3014275 RepID=UPI004049D262